MQRLAVAFLAGIAVLLTGSSVWAELKMPLGKWNAAVKVDYLQFTDDYFDEEGNLWEAGQDHTKLIPHFDENGNLTHYTYPVLETTDYYTNDGVYLGVEAFTQVYNNFYFGAEIGFVQTEKDNADWINKWRNTSGWDVQGSYFYEVSLGIEYWPIQVNVKYVFEPVENLVLGVGGGISYNYVELTYKNITAPGSIIGSFSASGDDWLFGGQVFAEILYTIDRYFVGVSGAYQFTEDFDVEGGDDEGAPNFNNFRLGGKIGFYF